MAGHWALWNAGIEHGDISVENMMFDPVTKRGVLNDFDLARWSAPNRKPSAEDNTGTLPFLALDLLNDAALEGRVRRLYRHDAESFAWCLIYLYVCMGTDDQGRIKTMKHHPLLSWFESVTASHSSKITLVKNGILNKSPLHQNIRPLVFALYKYWTDKYHDREKYTTEKEASSSSTGNRARDYPGLSPALLTKRKEIVQTAECYKELSDSKQFWEIIGLFVNTHCVGDHSIVSFVEKCNLSYNLYPSLENVEDQRAN